MMRQAFNAQFFPKTVKTLWQYIVNVSSPDRQTLTHGNPEFSHNHGCKSFKRGDVYLLFITHITP